MQANRPTKLPIGIQSFEKIRREGFLYVDKTALVYQLVNEGTYYFLSRPRRFGKSLLVSTLKAYFLGQKELFEGLQIMDLESQWTVRPVFHIDLNTQNYDSPDRLDYVLNEQLLPYEQLYGAPKDGDTNFGPRLEAVIQRAYEQTGRRVAILVDEYDKPLLEAIDKPELKEAYRGTLKGLYSVLKSKDQCIQFALLTGVTKFGKLSVFSGLNNLNDISMDYNYATLCGITEEELLHNFNPEIEAMALANRMSTEECVAKLRQLYDGYHFEEYAPGVYNPFSLINALQKRKFGSYWFQTGTPTFLVKLLQKREYPLARLDHETITADELGNVESPDPIPVIYQSGYLTIKGYDNELEQYTLGFPNQEVEKGFWAKLLPIFVDPTEQKGGFAIQNFVQDVRAGRTDDFLDRLRAIFADTPYELIRDLENHYQNILWILFKLMGFYTQAEYHTSRGRIDMVVGTRDYLYVMEFKFDGTAEEALAQINSKDYALPFTAEGREVVKIGLNFSPDTRNLDRWVVEASKC